MRVVGGSGLGSRPIIPKNDTIVRNSIGGGFQSQFLVVDSFFFFVFVCSYIHTFLCLPQNNFTDLALWVMNGLNPAYFHSRRGWNISTRILIDHIIFYETVNYRK